MKKMWTMTLMLLAGVGLVYGLTGSGTAAEPYLISTPADLEQVNNYLHEAGAYFELTQDIDLTGQSYDAAVIAPDTDAMTTTFVGISFKGVFNGAGKSIIGLSINQPAKHNSALFGRTDNAEIVDLDLKDIAVSGGYNTGGLVAYAADTAIVNCRVLNDAATSSVVGTSDRVGGLVGTALRTRIEACVSDANATVTGRDVGGLIGHSSTGSMVRECHASGTIYANGTIAGGLIGRSYMMDSVADSTATGTVTATTSQAGGLIGWEERTAVIRNCHASGNVTALGQAGGLIGRCTDGTVIFDCTAEGDILTTENDASGAWPAVGGLVGHGVRIHIRNCHATGTVEGAGRVGGLVGSNHVSHISRSSAVGIVTGRGFTDLSVFAPAGGLVGQNEEGSISNCWAEGAVSGVSRVGGLNGSLYNGMVTHSYATGDVTGTGDYIGGLVGISTSGYVGNSYARGDVQGTVGVGGLMGLVNQTYIVNSYSTGTLTDFYGGDSDSGLIGIWQVGAPGVYILDSFWDKDTAGLGDLMTSYGTGLTTAQMQDPQTFIHVGWGFYEDGVPAADESWAQPDVADYMPLAMLSGKTSFFGQGTADSPYEIESLLDLERVNMDLSAHYILMNDLNLAGMTFEEPLIANDLSENLSKAFAGVFDGNDKVIENLTIASVGHYTGLFGVTGVGGVIQDLGLENIDLSGDYFTGGLVARNHGANITNCYTTGYAEGRRFVGGLVGFSDGLVQGLLPQMGTIADCHSSVDVKSLATAADTPAHVAGLVGELQRGIVSNCHATGAVDGFDRHGGLVAYSSNESVIIGCSSYGESPITTGHTATGTAAIRVGGLVGHQYNSTVIDSWADRSVSGSSAIGDDVGGLIGLTTGTADVRSRITNCYAAGSVSGGQRVGGLAGAAGVTDFSGSWAGGTVTAAGTNAAHTCGGLVSAILTNSTVDNCYATGDVTSGAVQRVGGLIGNITGSSVVTNSWASGTVTQPEGTGSGEMAGGFAGRNHTGTIERCFATGNVIGNNSAGSFVGDCHTASTVIRNAYATGNVVATGKDVGGFVGVALHSGITIENCYATGSAEGDSNVAGFAGRLVDTVNITNCFWDTETSGDTKGVGTGTVTVGQLAGKTTEEMKTQATFTTAPADWNFSAIWFMCDGFSYPRLAWQQFAPGDIDLDGIVGIDDLELLAAYWLDDTVAGLCVDVIPDGKVDLQDFAVLAAHWLAE